MSKEAANAIWERYQTSFLFKVDDIINFAKGTVRAGQDISHQKAVSATWTWISIMVLDLSSTKATICSIESSWVLNFRRSAHQSKESKQGTVK